MRQKFWVLTVLFVSGSFFGNLQAHAAKQEFSKESLMIELTGKDPSKIDEKTLYAEIVGAYRANDEIGFKSRLQTFMTRFPNSSYADNCLYLGGQMAFANKNYPEAIRFFQKVLTQYPHSNKAVGAEFAKGQVYQRMNLAPQAKYVFQEVNKKYPGSPESFRASSELRLLK